MLARSHLRHRLRARSQRPEWDVIVGGIFVLLKVDIATLTTSREEVTTPIESIM